MNTIDKLGDLNTFRQIIKGTITEFEDDIITTITLTPFRANKSITKIKCPNVTKIYNGLNGATSLTSIEFPEAITLDDSYTFQQCSALTNVVLPKISSLTTGAFQYCTSLNNIVLPSVLRISSNSFYYCSNLQTVDLPAVTDIGSTAFSQCTLSKLIIRNTESVPLLNGTSLGATTNLKIYVPDVLVNDYKEATNWSSYADYIHPLSELPEE